MDTIINILDFIGILTIIYSIAIYVYIDNIYKAGGSIKDYIPWFVQLIVVYVYFIVILYIVNTIKG